MDTPSLSSQKEANMLYKEYMVKRAQYDDLIREAEKDRLIQEIKKSKQQDQPKANLSPARENVSWLKSLRGLFIRAKVLPGSYLILARKPE
jgi:hypothetical protein